MLLHITCYVPDSGTYYVHDEIEVPEMALDSPAGPFLDSRAVRDHLLSHPDLWPVTDLRDFHTTISLIDQGVDIQNIPIMIPARCQANTPSGD